MKMEINITKFFNEAAPMDYSASRAEIGQDAAVDTWRAACDDSADYMILDTEEKREAFKRFAQSAGFSEADEFNTWTDEQLNALCIQWIAGDMREAGLDAESTADDWKAYERKAERGTVSSRIFQGDSGEIYFYIGE
jgi:hypothetical protein